MPHAELGRHSGQYDWVERADHEVTGPVDDAATVQRKQDIAMAEMDLRGETPETTAKVFGVASGDDVRERLAWLYPVLERIYRTRDRRKLLGRLMKQADRYTEGQGRGKRANQAERANATYDKIHGPARIVQVGGNWHEWPAASRLLRQSSAACNPSPVAARRYALGVDPIEPDAPSGDGKLSADERRQALDDWRANAHRIGPEGRLWLADWMKSEGIRPPKNLGIFGKFPEIPHGDSHQYITSIDSSQN